MLLTYMLTLVYMQSCVLEGASMEGTVQDLMNVCVPWSGQEALVINVSI